METLSEYLRNRLIIISSILKEWMLDIVQNIYEMRSQEYMPTTLILIKEYQAVTLKHECLYA